MGLHVWLTVRRRLLTCSQIGFIGLFFLCLLAPFQAYADSLTITEETDVYFTLNEQSLVVIYGNSNENCENVTTDPYLWLYDDNPESTGELIAQDDDSNHGQGQCVSAKLYVTLEAGDYRLRAGYCCQQLGTGNTPSWGDGSYELVSEILLSPNTTTSSTSTTTTSTTTTTSSTTTTTEAPPSTTSSTTSTTPSTTVLVAPSTTSTTTTTTSTTTTSVPATTTVPTTTTTTVAISTTTTSTTTTTLSPTTTSSSTTTVVPTTTTSTIPPTTSTTSTTVAPTTTTTTLPPTTTTSNTTTSSTTTAVPTTSTTTIPAVTTTTLPPPPPNDAPVEQKKLFEQQVDVYSTPGYDDYVPAGSTISVQTRRTVIAATATIVSAAPTIPARRRTRR